MAQQRRGPSGRPGARPSGPRARPARTNTKTRTASPAAQAPVVVAPRRSSRFTGRAMVMVLVVSVLTISYASSLKAYFQQRGELTGLKSQIAASEASIGSLETERTRWQDPAFLKEQARSRFGYLMPGQTSYVVIGADGKPLAAQGRLRDPRTTARTPTAWWTTEWASVELAGNPPSAQSQHKPLSFIGGGGG